MKLTFLGTRGYIEANNDRHRRHTSTLVEYEGTRLMTDCGLDWANKVFEVDPDAILVTHAHPDHAFGLREKAPCPVYATQTSWDRLDEENLATFEAEKKPVVKNREPRDIESIGDGATLDSPMVRRKDEQLFGHTTIRARLMWCGENGVDLAIFTHCGSQIVEGDERTLKPKLKQYAEERGVADPSIAYDGDELTL